MFCLRTSFENEGIDETAVEPDSHPHPGLSVIGQVSGNQVVEIAVEMWHREHRQHPSDRLVLGGLPGLGHAGCVAESSDGRRARPKRNPAVINRIDAA
jgi:hypothetical protein